MILDDACMAIYIATTLMNAEWCYSGSAHPYMPCFCHTQETWSRLSPTRNQVHLRFWGLSFPVLGDVPNWDSGQTKSPSSILLWSDPKSEFSGTESPDPDPWESQICLLGSLRSEDPQFEFRCTLPRTNWDHNNAFYEGAFL